MPQVDFVISNELHHTAIAEPVVRALNTRPEYRCRVLSLCEFRGRRSPVERFQEEGVELVKVVPFRFRSPSSGGRQTGSPESSRIRGLVRRVSWHVLLNRPLRTYFSAAPNLVVLPNDFAFPYDQIVQILHTRHIPFILVQEGIRFPWPGANGQDAYGRGGATAIAAWGETSAVYFRHQGVEDTRIHLTGTPRFDHIPVTDWQTEATQLKARWRFGQKNLLFLSNPIDDQGFCTTPEKLALVRRFIVELDPLFGDPEFHLIVKLHGRESIADFQALITDLPYANQITISNTLPLYPLFTLSQAAIVLASTVGLEALLFDLPLGVLEIPRAGFVYNYVSGGAAQGLSWNRSMVDQVKILLDSRLRDGESARAYLSRSLATRADATGRIMDLIHTVLETTNGTSHN